MKKLEENNREINKVLLNGLYDIDNLKNDLDEILNIENITVSESLIQATLKRANEEAEQSKQPIQNIQPIQNKQPTPNKKGIPFRYGMIAACACILLVAGISLIAKTPGGMKESKSDMAPQEENTTDSSTAMDDMESAVTKDTNEGEASEESTSQDTGYNGSESIVNTEDSKAVPSFFDIADEEGNLYSVETGEIEKIIVYDENGLIMHNVTEASDIENVYNTFAKVDSQDQIEEVQNEKQEGQFVRQYDIIAKEGSEWSELHVLISSVDEDTSIVKRQLITSDEKIITHRIADVDSDIVLSIMNTVP